MDTREHLCGKCSSARILKAPSKAQRALATLKAPLATKGYWPQVLRWTHTCLLATTTTTKTTTSTTYLWYGYSLTQVTWTLIDGQNCKWVGWAVHRTSTLVWIFEDDVICIHMRDGSPRYKALAKKYNLLLAPMQPWQLSIVVFMCLHASIWTCVHPWLSRKLICFPKCIQTQKTNAPEGAPFWQ